MGSVRESMRGSPARGHRAFERRCRRAPRLPESGSDARRLDDRRSSGRVALRCAVLHAPGFVKSVRGGDEPLAGTAAGRVSRRGPRRRSRSG
ncbi:hypothetical protein WG70_27115 [Burkholderia oklahomensis EO147]|nr:hypothetical protein WG70_27115 [Burkholderia oklahomensis EO147]KUY57798.1 hypothetical protein WG70_08250 [Burkholderia oklahomensis EO147]